MKSTFRILFYAKWEASDEAKMLPIYVRITINGTKARFSLKIRVSEKIWDAKSGRAIGHSHEALQANRYLDSVVTRINTIYYRLCEQSEAVTAQMVRDEFLGVKAPSKTLLSVFAEFNDRQENLIGVDITQSTFNKFDLTFRRLEEFLRVKRNRPDIPVSLESSSLFNDFCLCPAFPFILNSVVVWKLDIKKLAYCIKSSLFTEYQRYVIREYANTT